MKMIVGLGNPGAEYDNTRHNVGFAALDALAQNAGCRVDKLKFKSLCGDCMIEGKRVLLMKPSTFMNLSGQAVTEAMAFYKIPMEHIIVISDDISLEPGRMRIRAKGSDGGHNGLKNIIYLSGRNDFPRIRLGVGAKPHPDYDLADWVLSTFSAQEEKALGPAIDRAADAALCIMEKGIAEASNRYSGKA
ncbi:MAG: aminoacyl-tRNA hydrolase [Clostridia bacterium]|nr:aminoacyl-tRNA hydrolase [Clostridia bacterium]